MGGRGGRGSGTFLAYFPKFKGSSKMLSESAGAALLLAVAAFFFVSFLALGAAGEESAKMSSETR